MHTVTVVNFITKSTNILCFYNWRYIGLITYSSLYMCVDHCINDSCFILQKSKLKIALHDSINHSQLSVANCQLLTANYLPFTAVFSPLRLREKKPNYTKAAAYDIQNASYEFTEFVCPKPLFQPSKIDNI